MSDIDDKGAWLRRMNMRAHGTPYPPIVGERQYNAATLRGWIAEHWPRRHRGFERHVIRISVREIRRMEKAG